MLITNQDELLECRGLISTSEEVAIDLESNYTDHQRDRFCLGISISAGDRDWYIPVGHKNWGPFEMESMNIQVPPNMFTDLQGKVIFHNAKGVDLPTLDDMGCHVPREKIWDIMIMHHYIDENLKKKDGGHDLATLSERYLSEPKEVQLKKAMEAEWVHTPPAVMEKYAIRDSRNTLELYRVLRELSKPQWLEQWENYDRKFMLLLMWQ